MPVPTVASLSRTLGTDLAPAPGFTAPDREISAVHISELLDPTGYLSGGELVLTTGLTLPRSKLGCDRYVARLVDAGLSALALGLGPVHSTVPPALAAACQARGLPLLVVPAPTPFLRITKAYWVAVSRSSEQRLRDVLTTQRALVDAAASPSPATNLLRTLTRSLAEWAATFTPGGEIDLVQPASANRQALAVQHEIAKLEGAGVHSAASFSAGSGAVVVFPLAVENRVAGYFAVGTDAPLDATRRRAVLTASALLSLDAVRRSRAESVADEVQRCIGLLVDMGHVDAARRLAGVVRAPSPPDHVRLLLARGRDSEAVIEAVHSWCPGVLAVQTDRHAAWFLVPVDHPSPGPLEKALRRADPDSTAFLSDPLPVEQVRTVRPSLVRGMEAMAPGARSLGDGARPPHDERLAVRLAETVDSMPETLVATLASFLRSRGQWEAASRELGVHRNTLRQRVSRCEAILGVELTDPDAAAELWLLLRRRGLA